MIAFLEKAWQEPDDGIWEVRGGRRHFTHSKVMAWVAIDRVVRIIEELGAGGDEGQKMLPHLSRSARANPQRGLRARLQPARRRVHAVVRQHELDASVLVMPHYGFLPASDPRVRGHGGRDREASDPRRLRAPLQHRARDGRASRSRRARSSPAASGWPTTTRSAGGWPTRRRCSSACSGYATISGCSPRSTSRRCSGRSATSRRRSRTWR